MLDETDLTTDRYDLAFQYMSYIDLFLKTCKNYSVYLEPLWLKFHSYCFKEQCMEQRLISYFQEFCLETPFKLTSISYNIVYEEKACNAQYTKYLFFAHLQLGQHV